LKKRIIAIAIAIIVLATAVAVPIIIGNLPKTQQEAMVRKAQKYLDRDLDYFGIMDMNWCVYFTNFVADKCGLASPANDPTANIFPPCSPRTWEENDWAATSIQHQLEWFTENGKGTLYYYEDFREITEGENKIKVTEDFIPRQGDLVYIDKPIDDDYLYDHVAMVLDFDPAEGKLTYIGGNQGDEDVTKSRVTVSELYLDGRTGKKPAGYLRPNYETEYVAPQLK